MNRRIKRDKYQISARFSEHDPGQMEAFAILQELRGGGRSYQSIITEAVLLSQGQQYNAPTLGDEAVYHLTQQVERLTELVTQLSRTIDGLQYAPAPSQVNGDGFELPGEDDSDYAEAMLDYLRRDED